MRPALEGKKVAVFGLAKSGLSAIRLLLRERAQVIAVDEASEADLGEIAARLRADGAALRLGDDPAEALRGAELVVVSPGVPLAHPAIRAAEASDVEVWGEVELASRFLRDAPVIGITGTNGKSTTTALCGKLFEAAGRRPFVGGNLGLPLSEAALSPEPFGAYVVELSSFQLEGARTLRCHGAAILNLTPDHLDRYPSHQAYGEAKERIFLNQRGRDFAVVNADDADVRAIAKRGARVPVFGFTLDAEGARDLAGRAFAVDSGFALELAGRAPERFRVANRALRGAHNVQNAMAAALLARGAGVDADAIQKGLDEYPGLPHRIESVATIRGVEWVNDSKATNVESSLVALKAFAGNLWLILGGKGKGAPYAPLVEAARGKVRGVLTIGADAPAVARAFAPEFAVHDCGTIEAAVARARELAAAGDVVLLSPACASYDQFKNFEHRGDVFRSLVRGMA